MSLWAMSLSGAVMIIAIVILRALLINQLPKKTFLILWGIVMVRLVIPFTAPSAFSIYSLIPEKEQSMNTQFSGIQDNLSETKKTTIVMLVASAIVIIGVTGTFATSANASDKIDNKNSEYIESTIAEDVMLAYNDEDGNIYYSADGGETFFNEKEFNEKYPSPEVEWWTYEE